MKFKDALYDGSDPLYAPGISFSRNTASWKCPKRYVDAGYPHKSINLNVPGVKGDEHQEARAKLCRQHTRDLMEWWREQEAAVPEFGTWAYVIDRYRSDRISPYAKVKQNTRDGYDYTCDRWRKVIGHMRIDSLTFETIKQLEAAMQDKGYSDSNIHRMMTMLRGLASYGSLIKETKAACRDVKLTLSDMRFTKPAPKSTIVTWEQMQAVVAAADQDGHSVWATGILMQWWWHLRPVDVRGQWLKAEGEGGIIRKGRRWQDGLTWEMFASDMSSFEKVISKTAKSMPEPYRFDLTKTPELRERLVRMRPETPVGPVFVSRTGLPYDQTSWSALWAKYRETADIPANVQLMDIRAGALTDAQNAGAEGFALRDAGQHSNISTTSRYVRNRSDNLGDVVELRHKARES